MLGYADDMTYDRFFAPARRMFAVINRASTVRVATDSTPVRQPSTIDEEAFARGKLQARIEAALSAQDEFGL